MNNIINKFLLAGGKFVPELNLRLSGIYEMNSTGMS